MSNAKELEAGAADRLDSLFRRYAAWLDGKIDEYVGFEPTVEQIAAWLKDADRRYRAEEPDIKWPYFYSELILDELAPSGLSEVHPHT